MTKMDLSAISSHQSELDILHPATGEPIGLVFIINPPDSPELKTKMRNIIDGRRHKAKRNQPVLSIDDEKASLDICMAAVTGWRWTTVDANWSGEQPTFNTKTLGEMLSRDWLRIQVDEHLADQKAFFTK